MVELPDKPKEPVRELSRYVGLVYGREKIGKTTLLASFPDVLFLTTEPGTKGLAIYEIAVKTWKDFTEAVVLLEKDKRFKTVAIDTADNLYDMALDAVCKALNIPYPGKNDEGKEDYGKSWKAVKQEFMVWINRLIKTNRGVWFTSHLKVDEIKPRDGEAWSRIHPSMPSQARGVIEALVDFFFCAEYMKKADGTITRVLITEGNDTVWAGARPSPFPNGGFPPIIPLQKKGGYDILQACFKGESPGVDVRTLTTARTTSKPAVELVNKAKVKAAIAKRPR